MAADQLGGVTLQLISAISFATLIVQFLYVLNPKFQAYSHILLLYSPAYADPINMLVIGLNSFDDMILMDTHNI